MKRWLSGILAALAVHLLILLFGGIFFFGSDDKSKSVTVEDVDVDVSDANHDEQKQELEQREAEEVKVAQERPPDMQQLVEIDRETPLADATPELSALSLAALESALGPGAAGGAGDFGAAFSLNSGGRIGGTGAGDAGDVGGEDVAFGLADLDQSARPVFQSPPNYPADLRQRKIEGVVTLLFVVDAEGRVIDPKVEGSTDPAFEMPALDAVRRWKFEPAVRNGKKVTAKLRIPIRFSLNS